MSRKHPKYYGNNQPRVDWKKIVNDCKDKFRDRFPCEARTFGFEQIIKIGVKEILDHRALRETGKLGHKKKLSYWEEYENIVKHGGNLSRWCPTNRPSYSQPTDLSCDDPYYDGVPVVDI